MVVEEKGQKRTAAMEIRSEEGEAVMVDGDWTEKRSRGDRWG